MANNINKNQIFNQIVELQHSLESLDKILFKVQCVSDSQSYIEQEEGNSTPLDYMPEVALEKIRTIREHTVNTLLDFYLKLYKQLDENEKE